MVTSVPWQLDSERGAAAPPDGPPTARPAPPRHTAGTARPADDTPSARPEPDPRVTDQPWPTGRRRTSSSTIGAPGHGGFCVARARAAGSSSCGTRCPASGCARVVTEDRGGRFLPRRRGRGPAPRRPDRVAAAVPARRARPVRRLRLAARAPDRAARAQGGRRARAVRPARRARRRALRHGRGVARRAARLAHPDRLRRRPPTGGRACTGTARTTSSRSRPARSARPAVADGPDARRPAWRARRRGRRAADARRRRSLDRARPPARPRCGRLAGRRPPDRVEVVGAARPALRHAAGRAGSRWPPTASGRCTRPRLATFAAACSTRSRPGAGESALDLYAGAGPLTALLAEAVGPDRTGARHRVRRARRSPTRRPTWPTCRGPRSRAGRVDPA